MNLLDKDRHEMFMIEAEDGTLVDLTEIEWYNIANFFKDVPLVGGFARDYQLGYNIAQKGPIAATLILAAMAGLGYKVYKNHFSKAAKACKQHKGQTKKSCIKAYKDQAIKLEIQAYEKMIAKCKMSKDPESCATKARKKIDKLRSRLTSGSIEESSTLKTFAAHYIDMHDIPTDAKIDMLAWLKGANELQIEHFLFSGGIMTEEPDVLSEIDFLELSPTDRMVADLAALQNIKADHMIQRMKMGGETATQKTAEKVAEVSETAKEIPAEMLKQLQTMVDKAKEIPEKAPEMAESAYVSMLAMISKVGSVVQQQLGRITDPSAAMVKGAEHGMKTGGIILGGTVLAALIATGAWKVYKSYLSKAAKACKQHKSTEKETCMRKFALQHKKRYIALLQKGKESCKFSKNPAKCTFKIDKKINKVKLQLGTLHKKVSGEGS